MYYGYKKFLYILEKKSNLVIDRPTRTKHSFLSAADSIVDIVKCRDPKAIAKRFRNIGYGNLFMRLKRINKKNGMEYLILTLFRERGTCK